MKAKGRGHQNGFSHGRGMPRCEQSRQIAAHTRANQKDLGCSKALDYPKLSAYSKVSEVARGQIGNLNRKPFARQFIHKESRLARSRAGGETVQIDSLTIYQAFILDKPIR
jgi:hypothetical protein